MTDLSNTNHIMPRVTQAVIQAGWFQKPGAYVLVDGQFGSTGKGLLAGLLAEISAGDITHCTTNAGPNSGHTAYYHTGLEELKIVTQQIPVAAAVLEQMGLSRPCVINAGAIIDLNILGAEVSDYLRAYGDVYIHPQAAVIDDAARQADKAVVASIAGTGKGVGPAIAAKVGRNINAVAKGIRLDTPPPPSTFATWDAPWDWTQNVVFVETAQGFSLGVNSQFYPNTTSRECTVMQAIADARIPAQMVKKVAACYRTYPIRVGNSPEGGYSGDYYVDQREISFSDIGQPEELTTVTKRVRRLFTWSRQQFRDSVAANRPDLVFINFANYLKDDNALQEFMNLMVLDYVAIMGRKPETVLVGFGARAAQIQVWDV